jgi:cellulose synthase operon protein B
MKIHRALTIGLFLIMITCLFLGNHTSAQAQTVTADTDTVTFAAYGKQEILLSGPIDSTGMDFNIPADWRLEPGSLVHLNFRAFVGDSTKADASGAAVGYIDVYMNSTWLQTVALTENGEYSVDIEIPEAAWNPVESRLPQTLRIALHDAVSCNLILASAGDGNWKSINVAISPTSYLYLPHQVVTMPTDLRQFPYPLYQMSFRPDKALVVVPQYPTESELQAALIVESALARLTDGNLVTTFATADTLDSASLEGSHAIFIGHPSAFSQLENASLPLTPTGDKFVGEQVSASDGILEMVPSPVDPSAVWVVVSGNDDGGIVKAAQSLGSGAVRPYDSTNLAIVNSVEAQSAPVTATTDVTLSQLGYEDEKYSGYGLFYFNYYFDVPPSLEITDGAYFELVYNNSALLNFEESGISILLNDQLVGSVRFNDRTTEASTAKFNIPANLFLAGKNQLSIEGNLSGATPCIPAEEIWVSVKSDSLLHLPSVPAADVAAPSFKLASFPRTVFPSFDNLAFVLWRENPASWAVAADIAYEIGKTANDTVLQPSVAYADAIPGGFLNNKSQIIIGRPSALPILQQLAPYLPAPFVEGSDVATETGSEFKYNISKNVPVGYLQILPSPSDNKKVILAVLGNSDDGLRSASHALADETIRSQMDGNLVVTYDNQVIVDKVESAPAAVSAATPVVVVKPTPESASDSQTGPFKLNLITIGVGVFTLIAIIALVALLVRPKKS